MMIDRVILSSAVIGLISLSCFADTITLKSAVRLQTTDGAVTLSAIAELDGREATALGEVVIAELGQASAREITVREVREKLTAAGAHWGRISLNGRAVTVRQARPGDSDPPMAMTAVALETAPKPQRERAAREEFRADSIVGDRTVRGSIATLLVNLLRLPARDVRLSFDAADRDWLEEPLGSAHCEVHPLSAAASDRVEVRVRLWNGTGGSRASQDRTVSVWPLIRVLSAQLGVDVEKDRMLTDADVRECEQWLPPSQAMQNITPVAAIGRIASKSMKAGEVLRDKHVRRDTLIKRGDLTTVRCFVGGAVISMLAEARGDGAEGDTIDFRKQGERETFRATITGRGEAVMDLTRK